MTVQQQKCVQSQTFDQYSDIRTVDTDVSVLVVDDQFHITSLVTEMLEIDGYKTFSTNDTKEAFKIIEQERIDAVITDLVMDKISGVDVLRKAKEHHPDAVLILMTGQPSLENVITVLREGAYDYLVKPFTLETLRMTFSRGIAKQRLQRENIQLKELVNLHKISEEIGSKLDANEIFKAVVEITVREFECDAGAILYREDTNGVYEIKYGKSTPDGFFKSEFLESAAPADTTPFIKNNIGEDDCGDWFDRGDFKSHIYHPIMVNGESLGQLHLMRLSRNNPFGRSNLAALSLICSKSGTALERAALMSNLEDTYLSTIGALANAIEARDKYTRDHTQRVFTIAEAIAIELGWDEEKIRELRMGGMLHDIGKIGVPDAILNKPGPLTEEEFEVMKEHPVLGAKMVEKIPFLKPALPYILYHHERYDGKGYPHGLKGEEIPIEGRLLAVVDTTDAITSDRPYRKGRGVDVAIQQLKEYSGTQFDPRIVEISLRVIPTILNS